MHWVTLAAFAATAHAHAPTPGDPSALAVAPSASELQDQIAALAVAPSASELQVQITAAIQRGATKFIIPPGVYNFSDANLEITGGRRISIVAAGVALWFGGAGPRVPGVNISNCDQVTVSGPLSISYYGLKRTRSGVRGITYNLLNSSDVTSEDVTINQAPFFSVTAFNGGGGHIFRRFRLPADPAINPATGRPTDPWPHERDAFHFTDLRRGVLLEDSTAAGFGDDFFNSHNTIMVVLRRESSHSLLLINPHLQNVAYGRNTVYGTNCVLENVRAGDAMSFFAYPDLADCTATRLGSTAAVAAESPVQVTDGATLADAAALAEAMRTNFSTIQFDASDVWRVHFGGAGVPVAVGRAALVNIDAFSTPGTVIRNNRFNGSKYNLGRFKSNGGAIINNTFAHAGPNLEITPLPWYFEGTLPVVRDVVVAGNTFLGEGGHPVHCGPYCGQTRPPKNSTCATCTPCGVGRSPWTANITLSDNRYENSSSAPSVRQAR